MTPAEIPKGLIVINQFLFGNERKKRTRNPTMIREIEVPVARRRAASPPRRGKNTAGAGPLAIAEKRARFPAG
jgi:hypothetical protein